MTLLNITNVITTSCAFVMVWAAIELWRLTRSPGIFVLVLATGYLTLIRVIVVFSEAYSCTGTPWVLSNRSLLIAPFWPAMAVALITLLRAMRGIYQPNDRRKQNGAKYTGPERRGK